MQRSITRKDKLKSHVKVLSIRAATVFLEPLRGPRGHGSRPNPKLVVESKRTVGSEHLRAALNYYFLVILNQMMTLNLTLKYVDVPQVKPFQRMSHFGA